jgi:type IV pilus assembly protein PilM
LIERLLGLEALPVPPHIFAVDAQGLRYGRFARANGSYELEEYHEVDSPPDLFGSGPLGGAMREPAMFAAPLAALIERISETVEEASLVVPDPWLRLTFTEASDLPRSAGEREEVLRWKLRRLVPFKVEELRIGGTELSPLPGKAADKRVLLGFGLDHMLEQIEDAFGSQGIRLGQISNESLSLLPAVRDPLRDVELGLVVLAAETGYSMVFVWRGEPVLHRFKSLDNLGDHSSSERLVSRDLRMTRAFLKEELSAARLGRVLLLAPEGEIAAWCEKLEGAFEIPPHVLEPHHLALTGRASQASVRELAPLLGAARQEIP